MIGHHDITRIHGQSLGHPPDTDSQGSEVDGDVWGVHDQLTVGVEDRAGEIETLFHVGGERGAPEHLAHVFRDRREAAGVDLIQGGADHSSALNGRGPAMSTNEPLS
jgi:hypothetical protein